MAENNSAWVTTLEMEWSQPDGFLGRLRQGVFDQQGGAAFITALESIKLPAGDVTIDRRLVSLLWYIPNFLNWQKQRVAEKGGDIAVYERLTHQVQGIVEKILGVP